MTDLAIVHRLAPHLPATRPEGEPGERAQRAHGFSLTGRVAPERDGLVTRPVCPDFRHFDDSAPFFVDWLTVSQTHPDGGLPVVSAGAVWATDEVGEVRWKSISRVQHEGSHETSVSVRCDGYRVELSGNVGRFGRPDNVFGFGLAECMRLANEILAFYGLPPFTPGEMCYRIRNGEFVHHWTGARISRIDLTANYESGSSDNCSAVLAHLAQQHKSKQRGRSIPQGETVSWGGGKRQYWKAYNKAVELVAHGCQDQRIIDFCKAVGLVRFEGTVRSNALTDMKCAYWGDYLTGWAMKQLILLFDDAAQIMNRAERSTDDLDQLPKAIRLTARDYLAGMNMRERMGRTQFYAHRRELLRFGIDIAITNIAPFKPRVQVIQLRPAVRPDWYQLAA